MLLNPFRMAPVTPSGSYRYWRLWMTAKQAGSMGATYFELDRIRLATTLGGASVLTAASPVVAHSTYSGSYPASRLVLTSNGTDSTAWMSADSGLPGWVYVDAGTPQACIELKLQGGWYTDCPTAFLIQGSNDATTWTTVKTVTGQAWSPLEWKTFTW